MADAACAVLEAHGIRCWIAPRDVTPGVDWGAEIIDAINGSRVMVLVYSSGANESAQIKREVERAVHKGMPIIPFRIEDVPMSKALEYFISSPHWLDALTPPLERHLEYLTRTISLLLSRPGPDAMEPPPLHPPTPAPGAASATPSAPPSPAPSRAPSFAPTAGAAPSPGLSRRTMLMLAATAVVLLGGYAVFFRSGAVDSQLIGNWAFATQDKNGRWLSTFAVHRDGSYQTHITVRDSGTIRVGQGSFVMVSGGQNVLHGTFVPSGPTSASITTEAGTVNWTRQPGSPMPQGPGSVAGVWDATPVLSGVTWHQTIDNRPNGTYRLVSTTDDAGHITAADGRWQMTSTNGPVTTGTYQLLTPSTLSLTGPLGPSMWTRQ